MNYKQNIIIVTLNIDIRIYYKLIVSTFCLLRAIDQALLYILLTQNKRQLAR